MQFNRPEFSSSSLSLLLAPFFEVLNQYSVLYCVCGNHETLPEYTSHDVDIWTSDLKITEEILEKTACQRGFTHYLKNITANGSNNFFFIENHGALEIIRIDLMDECAWKAIIPIVTGNFIGKSREPFKSFFISGAPLQTAMHLLYPLLVLGIVKDKYKEKIAFYQNDETFTFLLHKSLGMTGANRLLGQISRKDWQAIAKDAPRYRRSSLFRALLSTDFDRLKRGAKFLWANFARFRNPPGLFIVFIGLDGCGKTTILKSLEPFFQEAFLPGKSLTFYWRPFLFPRIKDLFRLRKRSVRPSDIDDNPSRHLKRASKLKMVFFFVKFLYYLADFFFGSLRYQTAWSRGGIVCFDRYYYDNILFPQRFGFIVPQKVMRFCMRFVPKPDLVFFLDASPEILLQRKQELPLEEITRQREEYKKLIAELPNGRVIDTSTSLNETIDSIIKNCLAKMVARLEAK